jgi:hypothetical protein
MAHARDVRKEAPMGRDGMIETSSEEILECLPTVQEDLR